MRVNEVFKSLQGEGRYMGIPVVFVRLQGCSLHCPWCDSSGTWDDEAGTEMTVDELLGTVQSKMRRQGIIVVTGGEPTEQAAELYAFVQQAKYEGWRCHLETNGTNEISRGYFEWIVCSPKPGNNYDVPAGVDELKYVVGVGDDLEKIIHPGLREKFARRIWLQPKANGDEIVRENVKWCYEQVMKDNRLRLGCQFHKLLGIK